MMHAHGSPDSTATLMERMLYEVKRVVVGQDRFLERVLIAMLAQGLRLWHQPERAQRAVCFRAIFVPLVIADQQRKLRQVFVPATDLRNGL